MASLPYWMKLETIDGKPHSLVDGATIGYQWWRFRLLVNRRPWFVVWRSLLYICLLHWIIRGIPVLTQFPLSL